ncbi:unnamed protein product [Paramecium pentaurelia]|uniref:Transmembrane protein n=1 Tax=Paramecium pentaurelia TaxID=43138 RepID=A0A8S1T7S2_9CILI|nr:unnamed protein product [Paramecium pentaurelia]
MVLNDCHLPNQIIQAVLKYLRIILQQEMIKRLIFINMILKIIDSTLISIFSWKRQALRKETKAPNNQQCVVSLTYQIIEDNENWIYRLDDQSMPFPKSIAEGQAQSIMKKQASGPNLQDKLTKPVKIGGTEITASIGRRVKLILSPNQPKNVIFAQMISIQDDRIVYQFLQTEDLTLQLLRCIYSPIDKNTLQCEVFLKVIGISNRLTRQNCQILYPKFEVESNFTFYLMYIDIDYSVQILGIIEDFQAFQNLKTIKLDSTDSSNSILSIFKYMDYLLIHTANKNILTFFINRPELFVLATLDKSSFLQYDYEDWDPKAFFTNKQLNPNILFIQHNNNILILDSNLALFQFITTLQITPKLDYSVAIGKDTFFVVQGKSSNDAKDAQIYEYNFADIKHVYLQKKLYLYWYDISTPLNADFNEETGHLFVRGVCLYSNKSYVLVVKPNTPQHEALDQAWDIAGVLIPDSKKILIASYGLHQTYLYLNVEGEQKLFALYNETVMIINSKIKQDIYSDFFSLNLKITNYNFQGKPEKFNILDINQQIKIFSTLNQITFNKNDFPFSQSGLKILSIYDTQTIKLGNEWYSGQIGNFTIDCDQCQTNIQLQATLYPINQQIFNKFEIRDSVRYDDDQTIIQTKSGLLIVDSDNILVEEYNFFHPYDCSQITISEDKKLIYSYCGSQYGLIHITECLFEEISTIELHAINEKLLTPLQDFQPIDFSVVRQKDCGNNQYSYKLIISNSCDGFIFIDFFITDLYEFLYLSIETLNLHDYLNNEANQYTLSTTKFLTFQLFQEPTYDQILDSLKISLIILTSDVSQYGFQFEFTAHSTVNTLLTTKALSAVIVRYGNFSVMNKLAIHDVYKSLVIPYKDQNFIYVCVYNLDNDSSSLIPTVIIGLFFTKKDNFFVVSQIKNPPLIYGIQKSAILILNNQLKALKSQKITLIAYNDFHEERIQFNLIVNIANKYDCIAEINNLQIYPTADEFLQWKVSQNFFDIVSLKYSFEQEESDFSVVQQIQQIGEQINHIQAATQIISSKAMLTKNKLWSNQFGFLNKNGSKCSIFFTNKQVNQFILVPTYLALHHSIKFLKLKCLIEILIALILFNCQLILLLLIYNTQIHRFYFQLRLLTKHTNIPLKILCLKEFQSHFRYRVNNILSKFLYQQQLMVDQLIILFLNCFNIFPTFDKNFLSLISKTQINQLNIVDIKIGLDGYIYLLDVKLGIFVVQLSTTFRFVKQICYNLEQTYAFDRILLFNNQEIFVIKGNNYYALMNSDGNIQSIKQLPFKNQKYPQNIKLSQNYVLLHNEGELYIYYSDASTNSLVDIINLQKRQSQFLQIPLQFGCLGQLIFKKNAKPSATLKNFTIIGKSQDQLVCQSKIHYKVLAKSNETIYRKVYNETPFPHIFDENNGKIKIGNLASGPNQIYNIFQHILSLTLLQNKFFSFFGDQDQDVFAKVEHQRTIQVNKWPKKSLYQTSLIGNNQETLFQVFQLEAYRVIIQTCDLINHERQVCKEFGNFTTTQILSDQIFSMWQDNKNIVHFITLETPFIIRFYNISNNKTQEYGFIQLNQDENKDELKVVAFKNQGIFLFVIQLNGNLSSYYIENRQKINYVTGANLGGFQGDWKPISLFGNRFLRQNVFFVQNENNIAIISYCNQEFFYEQKIDYKKAIKYTQINQLIHSSFEYNYEKLNNIFKQKNVELFGYQIHNPLGVSSHQQTGTLIIRTFKNDNVYLNIFKPNQLQHDTFYSAVQINAKIDDTFSQLDFIVLDPQLILIPNEMKQKYLTDYEIKINVNNADSQNNNLLAFTQKVKVINTFTNLIVDDTKLIQQIDIEPKQNSTSIKLKNQWISGQQAYCTLKQEKANDIVLQQYLQETINDALKITNSKMLQFSKRI